MRRLAVLLVSAVMALTLVAFAVATGASAQQPGPSDFYGVLYWSDTQLHWETGTTKAAADEAASNACQDANDGPCEFAVWVNNGWAAYTEGNFADGTFSANASWGRTQKEAAANGMTGCQDSGATGCTLVDSFKTRFNPNKQTRGGFS